MQTVRRLVKVVLALGAVAVLVILLVPTVTYCHDSATRGELLNMVARELPPNASIAEMAKFMQRHRANSGLDEAAQLEYGGFVPQTACDRFWGDRKVKLVLIVNRNTRTFSAPRFKSSIRGHRACLPERKFCCSKVIRSRALSPNRCWGPFRIKSPAN
jgi:hypothetical protein